MNITYIVESNEITVIKQADQEASGSGNLEIVKTAAKKSDILCQILVSFDFLVRSYFPFCLFTLFVNILKNIFE